MTTFSIRLALPSDYKSVLEMSEGIHNGYDYLPNLYHKWVSDEKYLVFLGEIDNEIVGLLAAQLTADDTTVTHKARRIHIKIREVEVFHQFSNQKLMVIFERDTPQSLKCIPRVPRIMHQHILFNGKAGNTWYWRNLPCV